MLNEESPFSPKSPYAISKLAAYWLVRNYRDSKGLWAVNGILFNHESARRGPPTRVSIGEPAEKQTRLANVAQEAASSPCALPGASPPTFWPPPTNP